MTQLEDAKRWAVGLFHRYTKPGQVDEEQLSQNLFKQLAVQLMRREAARRDRGEFAELSYTDTQQGAQVRACDKRCFDHPIDAFGENKKAFSWQFHTHGVCRATQVASGVSIKATFRFNLWTVSDGLFYQRKPFAGDCYCSLKSILRDSTEGRTISAVTKLHCPI